MKPGQRLIISLLLLLLVGLPALAQETSDAPPESASSGEDEDPGLWQRFLDWREERISRTDSYQVVLNGPGYAAIQDLRMSPRIYRGPGFVAFAQLRDFRPKETVLQTLFFQFAYPLTEETISGDSSYNNPRGTVDLTYLRRVAELPLQLGGGLSGGGNLRTLSSLSNSAFNYDISVSANASARWQHDFSLFGRDAEWHAQLSVPLFSWVSRMPAYNISYVGPATTWAFPWDFYRLRLNLGLSRLLKRSDENRFSIEYLYDFYGMSEPNREERLTLGNHAIVFGYALKTK